MMNRIIVQILIAICASLPANVVAQEVTPRPAVMDSLEEIIVTATRRESRLQSAPPGVHVVTGEELRKLGAMAFADYARTVPGLSYTDGGTGGEKQTIRGISVDPWFEINSGTAVYLDEVPLTHAGGGVGPPFNSDPVLVDIERIEILRGPQGTLFGAGAIGGAIRILTKQPDVMNDAGEVAAALTTTEDGELGYSLSGIVNAPLYEGRAAIRAVAFQQDLGGVIDNVSDGRSDVDNRRIKGARLAGKLLISDKVNATARVAYQDRRSNGLSHVQPTIGNRQQNRIGEFIGDEWTNYNIVLDVEFDWGSLVSSSSYLDRRADTMADVSFFLRLFFGLDQPLNVVNREVVNDFVQEIRLVSDDSKRCSWLAGVYYQDQDQDIAQDFPSPGFDAVTGGLASMFGPADNLFVRREQFSSTQRALYGEVTCKLANKLALAAGGRRYDIDRDYAADNAGLLFIMGQLQESSSASDSGTTPRISLNYAVHDGLSLFAIAATGYRQGGINPPIALSEPSCALELESLGFSESPTSYDSDSVVSLESGARYRSANGRMRINAAVYHLDWSDMQTQKLLNCGAGFAENAGDADSAGVELELVSVPLENLQLAFTASYNRAELSDDVPNLGGVKGDRLPGVPRLTAHASLNYSFPAFGDKSAFTNVNVQYVGKSYMGFDQSASPELAAYTVGNISVGLTSDAWTAALFINNVADKMGTVFINDNILGEWRTQIRPRTIGVKMRWHF